MANRLKLMVQGSIEFKKLEGVCRVIMTQGFKCTVSDNGVFIFEKVLENDG